MMRTFAVVVVGAAILATLAGCGSPGPTRELGANEFLLPADPGLVLGPQATPLACGGIGLDATLMGSPSDPRKVWLQDAIVGGRLELVWPTGYIARFAQSGFDVLDANGKVVIVGGSHVDGACVSANDAYWLDLALP